MSSNPFRTGLFVLSGLTLLIVTLFLLGLSDLFVQKAKFVTLVQESVQGLDVGSSVRYRGVPVGNVSAIRIQPHDKMIRIEMEIREQPFSGSRSFFTTRQEATRQFREFFEHELASGLRLRLNYAGITGLKYVELDYFDLTGEKDSIPRPPDLPSEVFYVKSQPSVFTDMLKTLSVAMDKVSRIPFDKIADNLQNSLENINRRMSDPNITATIENAEAISRSLNRFTQTFFDSCNEKSMTQAREQIVQTITDISKLAALLKTAVEEAKIGETAGDLRKTANSTENTMAKLERVLDSLNMLLDYLNRDPSALIRGKKAKTVEPGQMP